MKNKKNNKDRHSTKQKNQRILHIYSASQLPSEQQFKAVSFPLKKHQKPSLGHHRSKDLNKRQKMKGHSSTVKIKPPQIYERIPIGMASSNTNSEIQFSNYGETIKDAHRPLRRPLYIDCDNQALLKEIWAGNRKKAMIENEAATKIQKVFRGFMTRKLLQKYVQEYQQKLNAQIDHLKKNTIHHQSYKQDSFYDCELKYSYFLSNKKEKRESKMFSTEEKYNIIDFESSIMEHQVDMSLPGVQEHHEKQRQGPSKSSLKLNESQMSRQAPQISLSFGYQAESSPHFPHRKPFIKQSIHESPQQERKHTVSLTEDHTRDVISHNITVSPNYYQQNRSEKGSSHMTSLQKAESEQISRNLSAEKIEQLKSTEKAKWEHVIEFLNKNLQSNFDNAKTKELMSAILDFSVKNREELNQNQDKSMVTPTTITYRNDNIEPQSLLKPQNEKAFKKKRWEEQINLPKTKRNQNMPLARKVDPQKSIFERTSIMKQYFLQNMYLEDQQIEKMMQLRENVLRKRQSNSLIQLNHLLENNMLTQDQFLHRLSQLNDNFRNHKKDIERLRQEIAIGYKAQLLLLQNTAIDARYLGYNIPFCRSMQIFPNQPKWRFDNVMIDELNMMVSRRSKNRPNDQLEHSKRFEAEQLNKMIQDVPKKSAQKQYFIQSQSQESEQPNFQFKETDIYKKYVPLGQAPLKRQFNPSEKLKHVDPYTRCAAVAVFDAFEPQPHQMEDLGQEENLLEPQQKRGLTKEVYKFEGQSSDESVEDLLNDAYTDAKAQQISEIIFKRLLWECMQQLASSTKIYRAVHTKTTKKGPEQITKAQRLAFLQMFLSDLPAFSDLQFRLNQKMYPNLKELLYSMRDNDSEEEDNDSEYIQIGHYQYVLNQDICFKYIQRFMGAYRMSRDKELAGIKKAKVSEDFQKEYRQFCSEKLKNLAFSHKMEYAQISKHFQEYREQILRIQLHMMFDVWNEQLIKERQNKSGYSGIGINELSLSLIDRICKPMNSEAQYISMMQRIGKRIEQNILSSDLQQKLAEQLEQNVGCNDSQWVLYSQEALQYGFDLTKLIQLELIFECLNEIHSFHETYSQGGSLKIQIEEQQSSLLNSEEEFKLSKRLMEMREQLSDSQQDSFYK